MTIRTARFLTTLLVPAALVGCISDKVYTFTDTAAVSIDGSGSAGVAESCATFSEQSGSNLNYGDYPGTASSGPECHCQLSVSGKPTMFVSTVQLSSDSTRPNGVALKVPWSSSADHVSISSAAGPWEANHSGALSTSAVTDINGDYAIYQAIMDADSSQVTCDVYGPTLIDVTGSSSERSRKTTREDGRIEDALTCAPGDEVSAEFQLVSWTGMGSLLPVWRDGDPRFAGMDIRSVEVLDWGEADALTLHSSVGELTLTEENASASLQADTAWIWSARWEAELWGSQPPRVRVQGACVSNPEPRVLPNGYTVRASDFVPVDGEDMRLVARVLPDASDNGPYSHHLMFELEGTRYGQGVPLTSTGEGSWTFDFEGDWMDLQGEARVTPEGLRVELEEGWIDRFGALPTGAWTFPSYQR